MLWRRIKTGAAPEGSIKYVQNQIYFKINLCGLWKINPDSGYNKVVRILSLFYQPHIKFFVSDS